MQISSAHLLRAASHPGDAVDDLARRFQHTRAFSMQLAAPLSAEDAMLQSMPDASPAKWHLAHTSWFFEHFVLATLPGYRRWNPQWDYLFNSYYTSIGPAHARPQRGLLSRPSLNQVRDYRDAVDAAVARALATGALGSQARRHLELGIAHEQQHQELLLTDIKHALWCNPLQPAYLADLPAGNPAPLQAPQRHWLQQAEAVVEIGAPAWPASPGFAYDNESPRHRVLLLAHAIDSLPVSNHQYRRFVQSGGYRDPRWWMSEGWALVQDAGWQHPLYWEPQLEREYTLAGWLALDEHAPVCHLSWYEADAYARWAGARLPTEFEWEHAAAGRPLPASFAQGQQLHPQADEGSGQWFGAVWQWTASAYAPYPGFRSLPGSAGEYNGKFMSGQQVLRGSSCATPAGHVRSSYRNFFAPTARWQFSGLRLAQDRV
jgi:ergothioneine biosynthesis protein EgtB